LMRGNAPNAIDATVNPPATYQAELGWTNSDLMSAAPVVTIPDTGVGTVTATLDGNVSSGINPVQVVLTRTANGSWTCATLANGASAFNGSLAPAGCPAS